MLRLQQFERLLKAMLTHRELSGTLDTLVDRKASQETALADKTLGILVGRLFDEHILEDGALQGDILDEAKIPPKTAAVGIRFNLTMSAADREVVKAALADLVKLRNEMVHHLIERFNVWSDDGCHAAMDYLTGSYSRIDGHYAQLRTWATGMEEARARAAAFFQSAAFKDALDGITPEGAIDWQQTAIVQVLREGLRVHGVDGWAPLETVRKWAAATHDDQTPERYRCRGWPQVLYESRLFDYQYREAATGGKEGWYKERPSLDLPPRKQ